jgi:hypothetical protein
MQRGGHQPLHLSRLSQPRPHPLYPDHERNQCPPLSRQNPTRPNLRHNSRQQRSKYIIIIIITATKPTEHVTGRVACPNRRAKRPSLLHATHGRVCSGLLQLHGRSSQMAAATRHRTRLTLLHF